MADDADADQRPEPPIWAYENDHPANVVDLTHARAERDAQAPRGVAYGRLQVMSDADAANAAPRDYYLKSLFSPNEMSVVYGVPGCGKSFWALYVVRAVTRGREVLGKRVHQTNALFMALEGVAGFEKRLKAEILTNDESEGFYYIAQPVNLFDDPKSVNETIAAIQGTGTGMLIVDTLNRAMPGGSENAPEDMGRFISNIDAIRATTGVHVMIIHHSGKDETRGMRGHSALLGAADVVIEIAREKEGKDRLAKVHKAKDDADGEQFAFKLVVKELGTDADGDPITTCVVEEVETPEQAEARAVLKPLERLWLETMQEYFAREKDIHMVAPEPGMATCPCATRDEIREWIKTRGLVGVAHSVASAGVLSSTDRSKFARMLESLKIKKKIGIHGNWVWLV